MAASKILHQAVQGSIDVLLNAENCARMKAFSKISLRIVAMRKIFIFLLLILWFLFLLPLQANAQCSAYFAGPNGGLCPGASGNVVFQGSNSTTYYDLWINGSPNTGFQGNGSQVFQWPAQIGNSYQVRGSSGTCYNYQSAVVTIEAKQPGVVSISTNSVPPFICIGNSITLYAQGGSGYSWGGGSIVVSPTVNTNYTVSGTESNCGTYVTSSAILISVAPQVGQVTITGGPTSFCQGALSTSTYTSNTPANLNYLSWSLSPPEAGSIGSSSGIVTWNTSYNGPATVTVTAYSPTNCNFTTQDSRAVTIHALPAAATVSNVSAAYGSSITLTASGASGSEVYKWYNSSNQHLYTGSTYPNPVLTGATSITYYVTKLNQSTTCETLYANKVAQVVTLYVSDPIQPVGTTNTCGQKTLTFAAQPNGVTWYWHGSNNNSQATDVPIASSGTITIESIGLFYFRAKANGLNLWSNSVQVAEQVVTSSPTELVLTSYDNQSTIVQATNSVRLMPGYFAQAGSMLTVRISAMPECNDYVNWNEQKVFNEAGAVVGLSRSYSDGFGNVLQSQSKDFISGKIVATQPLFNTFGIAVGSSLPAPILETEFIYKSHFVTNESGYAYRAGDFDGRTGSSPGTVDNPKPVSTHTGTVGWYYSSNNNLETLTPTTQFPYSRSFTEEGPEPTNSRSSGPGEAHRMGSTHESKSDRYLITSGELAHYYTLRSHFSNSTTSQNLGYKYISTDPNGKRGASFVDADGRSIATAIVISSSGNPPTSFTYDNWSYTYYNDAGQVTATVAPKDVNTGSSAKPPATEFSYDHLGRLIQTISPDEGTSKFVYSTDGKIRFSENDVQRSASPKRFSYTNYDYLGRLIESGEYTSNGTNPYVFEPHSTASPATYSVLNIVDNTGFTGVSKTLDAARCAEHNYITYDAPGAGSPATQGFLYGQVSKTENENASTWYSYDEFGQLTWTKQLIKSLGAQNQAVSWTSLVNVTANGSSLTKTSGSGSAWDAGAFSSAGIPSGSDGWIEFTAGQTNTDKMMGLSATNPNPGYTSINYAIYTKTNGLIDIYENGVMKSSTALSYTTSDLLRVERQGSTIVYRKNGVIIYTSAVASSGALYADCTFGAVNGSFTSVTLAVISAGGNIKSIDYTYDFFGNVTQVAYQAGQPDKFYHHYEYDVNNRLVNVLTSFDGTNKTLQAKYRYYLHGPLKRIELATNLQGMDYVYTINGALKSINHSDIAKDPGADGANGFSADVYGQTFNYYDSDYAGAGYSAGSVADGGLTNQYGGAIKALSWFTPVDNPSAKKIYGYTYDNQYQLQNAQFGSLSGSAGSYTATFAEPYREGGLTYDKNGNIQALLRKGKTGNTLGNYAYTYTANTNKLASVTNGGSGMMSYTYNTIGQMTQQVESGVGTLKVYYNAYGLVKEVRDAGNILMTTYAYDDRGNRLKRTSYAGGIPVKDTYYVSDASGNTLAIYEQVLPGGSIQLTEVPVYGSGRVALYKPVPNAWFYELNDHLGNVRAVIGPPRTDVFTATMETETATAEDAQFRNIAPRYIYTAANNTPSGNEAIRVNNGQTNGGYPGRVAGAGISLKVSPGDVISAEVWGYYDGGTGYSNTLPLATIVAAAAGVFGGVSGAPGDPGKIYTAFNQTYGGGFAGGGGSGNDAVPAAYLNMIMFDNNLMADPTTLPMAAVSVTSAANGARQKLSIGPITIPSPGYVYIYVDDNSNSPNWVWFDDLKVTHLHSPYVAGADYYPFGLTMSDREITTEPYRFGYQGQYSEENSQTGWNEFDLRMYDSRFGRWISPDPYGQFASPYMGMGDNPVRGADPDGGLTVELDALTVTASKLPSFGTVAGSAVSKSLLSSATTSSFCPSCPDPFQEGNNRKIGDQYIFDTDGPHNGAVYELTSFDPKLGKDNWTRISGGDLQEMTVKPSNSAASKVKRFVGNFLNPFVDVGSTLVTSTRNGYVESIYGRGKYNKWDSYSVDEDGVFQNFLNVESDARAAELITNTVSVNATIVSAGINVPLSPNKVINFLGNTAIKAPPKAGIVKAVEYGLSAH